MSSAFGGGSPPQNDTRVGHVNDDDPDDEDSGGDDDAVFSSGSGRAKGRARSFGHQVSRGSDRAGEWGFALTQE